VSGGRKVTYCIVPRELANEFLESLRQTFRNDPNVEVIVERRVGERRSEQKRRQDQRAPSPAQKRRRIRAESGRRIAERRAQLIPVMPPAGLRHLEEISFVERIEPSTLELEDADTARLIMRIQADGENSSLLGRLYERYFDRVYGYLYVTLQDSHEAEDAAQEVFMRVIEALPKYERRGVPLRAWLFRIVRNCAISRIRQRQRVFVESPEDLARRVETGGEVPEATSLEWLDDRELLGLVERLPMAQRQVIVLRYMLELRSQEIAEVLGRRPDAIRQLHHRAMTSLRARLKERGASPKTASV
jgi:RNA polymerase sigma-70 factor, ECF subfamily